MRIAAASRRGDLILAKNGTATSLRRGDFFRCRVPIIENDKIPVDNRH